ncbi:MAG: penicillin-binding protein 2 [Candidatus Nealsonbacteria bacterium]
MLDYQFSGKFKRRKIKLDSIKNIEPQEIFLDNLAKKKEAEFNVSEKKMEVHLSKKTLKGLFFFAIFIILVLFVKTFQFQVLEYNKFAVLAEKNKFIIHSIQANRGVIYDINGEQLVFNKPSFNLILNKYEFSESKLEQEKILKEVSQIIGENLESIKEKINKESKNIVLISENLDHQKLIILETKISNLTGFKTEKSTVREYKDSVIFSHILGYTGIINSEELKENPETYFGFDYVGRSGIEKTYEDFLRKNLGEVKVERDAIGNEMSKQIISLPDSGKSLVLWIDSELQRKIEEKLKETLEKIGSKRAVAIAINPNTGGIMSLVSIPSFDNNLFSKEANPEDLKNLLTDQEEPLFNRAITGRYSTGSTIKPFMALAALEEKLILADKNINCEGKISIEHRYDPEIQYEYKDNNIHGLTNVRKAIAESCNVFFYTIGGGYKNQKGLGPSNIKKYLELFNWTQKTGIDIPGEIDGFVPSPEWKKETKNEDWWDGDTYNLSIGQGDIMITPLEVAVSYVAIANGGTLYKPKIVKEIVDSEKNLIEEIKSEIIKKDFFDYNNLKVVREGMRMAVTGIGAPQASSILLNSLSVQVAAKTGTAQTSIKDVYHNWIAVFAPYDNPEIVLVIMFEDVQGVQSATVPTAKEILQWYFDR